MCLKQLRMAAVSGWQVAGPCMTMPAQGVSARDSTGQPT